MPVAVRASPDLAAKAERFQALHSRSAGILVLPNAWDVTSARVLEETPGCRAIGTSSAGIAAVLGYVDRKGITREEMLDMVGRIAHAVDVPVTADVEAGYGDSPAAAAETARAAIAAGAVGLNIEDGQPSEQPALVDVSLQVEKIAAVREAAQNHGVPIVINARTDSYWQRVDEPEAMLAETVRRGRAYIAAGADCLFVPGVADHETIKALVAAIPAPLNVLAGPGVPPVHELERLGVARVSVGSGFVRAIFSHLRHIAREYLVEGTYDSFTGALPYPELARILGRS